MNRMRVLKSFAYAGWGGEGTDAHSLLNKQTMLVFSLVRLVALDGETGCVLL